MAPDTIFIEALCVPASIGVFDWEKEVQQDLFFDVEVSYSIARAASSDDIRDTVCYAGICELIANLVNQRHYDLLEHLIEIVARELLSTFDIDGVKIKLSKPGAVPEARMVGVSIERERHQ